MRCHIHHTPGHVRIGTILTRRRSFAFRYRLSEGDTHAIKWYKQTPSTVQSSACRMIRTDTNIIHLNQSRIDRSTDLIEPYSFRIHARGWLVATSGCREERDGWMDG